MEWFVVAIIFLIFIVWLLTSSIIFEGFCDPAIPKILPITVEFVSTIACYMAFRGVCSCGV